MLWGTLMSAQLQQLVLMLHGCGNCRSGRTGRAGSTGICVMLVDRKREGLVPLIERRAGVKFERIGTPQPRDMARIAGTAAVYTRICAACGQRAACMCMRSSLAFQQGLQLGRHRLHELIQELVSTSGLQMLVCCLAWCKLLWPRHSPSA